MVHQKIPKNIPIGSALFPLGYKRWKFAHDMSAIFKAVTLKALRPNLLTFLYPSPYLRSDTMMNDAVNRHALGNGVDLPN